MRRILAESPSLPLLVVAMATIVWISPDEGGFHGTTFLPATILLLTLLLVGLLAMPAPRLTRPQWVTIGLLVGYAAWSYLSILWADQQGLAWDGANRTVMYAVVFALFVLWPTSGRTGAALAAAYALGIAGVGLVELIRASGADSPTEFFAQARLSEPTGYANANVALWMSAFWPVILLAGRREVPAALRGLLLSSAGLLTALSILGQSRAWVVVLPLMLLLAVVLVPGRGRTIGALALLAAPIAAISGPLLAVYEDLHHPASHPNPLSGVLVATLIMCAILALAGTVWGLLDRGVPLRSRLRPQLSTAMVVAFLVLCSGGLIAFTVARGNPVTKATAAWNEFKKGGDEPTFRSARLGRLGGTNRYDFWRVAWRSFTEHPLLGVGVDNFGRQYLLHGDSPETPAYPHSVELRTLSETGLIGFLSLAGALTAALVAACRRLRQADGIVAITAATGIVVFVYFIAHGSLDWFWEFPALGAPAFALLGMATVVGVGLPSPFPIALTRVRAAAGGLVFAVLAAVLAVPWLAERDLRGAREIASSNPSAALVKLDRAADLNPLSPSADETAGVIERREGSLRGAEDRFRKVLEIDPGNPFAYLQLALIASVRDSHTQALRLIRQARALNPRDQVTRKVQRRLEAGLAVNPAAVDRWIIRNVEERTGTR